MRDVEVYLDFIRVAMSHHHPCIPSTDERVQERSACSQEPQPARSVETFGADSSIPCSISMQTRRKHDPVRSERCMTAASIAARSGIRAAVSVSSSPSCRAFVLAARQPVTAIYMYALSRTAIVPGSNLRPPKPKPLSYRVMLPSRYRIVSALSIRWKSGW